MVASHDIPLPQWVFLLVSNGIELGGRVHVPSNGRDIYICSGIGQAFQCGGKYSEGKKHKMCHVCMRDGLLFFFASALAF